ELALVLTPTQLRRRVARLRDELHVEPLAERHARAREDRAVWLVPDADGMALLCALLPAPVAVGAYGRLDRIARCLRDGTDGGRNDGPEDEASAATGTCGEKRTLAQLRADALADLLCDGDVSRDIPSGDGETAAATFVPGVRAEVRLTLAASTALGRDDAPADLDGYGLIPADAARQLAGAASTITRVLTDPDTGTVLSVGRTHRLPPPRMRLALQLRDRTCRFPGCSRSAARAEADHTVEWRHGGQTSLDNLASLCTAHHHVRHGDRWTYVLHPDGTAHWTSPTGRRVTTRPGDLLPDPPRRRPAPPVEATCAA
ncbi:HNH endonuclease signature motif containing protein, partial [Rathayibacter sp. Leaf296]|uniref:HNH endonuclease signature motif containing protein n=1 Tax=Rathayibacter sp. Leaf296 TaxID=1736327 RepID=UPI0012F9A704